MYRYTLYTTTMSQIELKALQGWMLEREFRKVPGVADVVSWGGGTKQYQITVDPSRLRAYNLVREGNVRRVVVKWSARERDMGGLVAEAMKKVAASVRLPAGYRMVRSGRFEDQQRALVRLYFIVPLAILSIFVVLFGAFQSIGDALLIMLNLPFAIIGGTLALFFWGRTSTFRPGDVVSAIVAIIGFLPAAFSQSIGAEIQRPPARVVGGGLVSSTVLTLLALPAVYALFARRRARPLQ